MNFKIILPIKFKYNILIILHTIQKIMSKKNITQLKNNNYYSLLIYYYILIVNLNTTYKMKN